MHACIHTFTNIHTLRLPDIACPDITHHDIIHPDITHRDIIHPDITHRDIIHPDIIHPDIIHCDIKHPDIIHQDIIRLDITNPYPSMIISHSTMQMSVVLKGTDEFYFLWFCCSKCRTRRTNPC